MISRSRCIHVKNLVKKVLRNQFFSFLYWIFFQSEIDCTLRILYIVKLNFAFLGIEVLGCLLIDFPVCNSSKLLRILSFLFWRICTFIEAICSLEAYSGRVLYRRKYRLLLSLCFSVRERVLGGVTQFIWIFLETLKFYGFKDFFWQPFYDHLGALFLIFYFCI